jgi:hypothetical protein
VLLRQPLVDQWRHQACGGPPPLPMLRDRTSNRVDLLA